MNSAPTQPHPTLLDGSYADCATAMVTSNEKLMTAAGAAIELLAMAGVCGMRGDTADDLRLALALHGHLVHQFNVKVRTSTGVESFRQPATSASNAYQIAADKQGDTPCGITVMRAGEPDEAALTAAHRSLNLNTSLEAALKDSSLKVILNTLARKQMRHRPPMGDFKQRAANDRD